MKEGLPVMAGDWLASRELLFGTALGYPVCTGYDGEKAAHTCRKWREPPWTWAHNLFSPSRSS